MGRKFNVTEINSYWVGDITQIHTGEGWLYLTVVIDLYSPKVVGWSLDSAMKAKLLTMHGSDGAWATKAEDKPDLAVW